MLLRLCGFTRARVEFEPGGLGKETRKGGDAVERTDRVTEIKCDSSLSIRPVHQELPAR